LPEITIPEISKLTILSLAIDVVYLFSLNVEATTTRGSYCTPKLRYTLRGLLDRQGSWILHLQMRINLPTIPMLPRSYKLQPQEIKCGIEIQVAISDFILVMVNHEDISGKTVVVLDSHRGYILYEEK
jgi:hypothetical protein